MPTPDVVINNNYPGVNYEPTETTGTPLYHEDREVSLTGGPGSQQYRTVNAQLSKAPPQWALVTSGQPAYATVQNPDGSIHYFTKAASSAPWTTWDGSDNNTVYNGVDFGMSPSIADNSTAFLAALNAIIAGGGGTLFIPSGSYTFTHGVSRTALAAEDVGIIIAGTGATELVANFGSTGGTLFSFDGFNTEGNGIRFHNLRITYATSPSLPAMGPAVYVKSCENISFDQVYFSNCPGVLFDDNMSLQCGLTDCTIDYATGTNNQIMVVFSGSEDYIHNCVIRQKPKSQMGAPLGCTGVQIQSATEPYITNTHISDFDTGISIVGGGKYPLWAHFANIACQSNANSVLIEPTSSAGQIYDVMFDNCILSQSADSTETTPGVKIDTNGGPNSNVADIQFNNCIIRDWGGAGIQINAGQDIIIDGCRVGSCAVRTAADTGGITITGAAANVVVNACDCSGTVPGGLGQQPYGISVIAAVAGAYIRGCILTGNKDGAVFTNPFSGTQIEITDCSGYNDQGTVLQTTSPTGTFKNTSGWTNAPNGWFGPIAFYVTSSGHVTIDGTDTNLSSGGFTLSSGESASIAGIISHFLAVGK